MIFSSKLSNSRLGYSTGHPDDFLHIRTYKDITELNIARLNGTKKNIELILRYRESWKGKNYQTKLNLFNLRYNYKRFYEIPYYQKNRSTVICPIDEAGSARFATPGYIPDELFTSEYIDVMLRYRVDINLSYLPDRLKTRSMVFDCILSDMSNIFRAPDDMLTPDFIIELISRDVILGNYIPPHLITLEVTEALLKRTANICVIRS